MAGKVGSASFSVLLVDGYDFLASKVQNVAWKITALQERSHGLGDTKEAMTPTGLSKLEVTQTGAFFDDTTNQTHTLLTTAANQQVSRTMAMAPYGNTVGSHFVGASGVYAHAYDVLGQVGGLTKANVTYTVSGTLEHGVIVQHQAAQTADWTGTGGTTSYYTDTEQRVIPITSNSIANPTVVTTAVPHGLLTGDVVVIAGVSTSSPTINGEQTVTVLTTTTFTVPINVTVGGTGGTLTRSSTSAGSAGYQHVSALSGFSGFVGKIQHSTDASAWSDLVTFANVTSAPAAERKTSAGTVSNYLRFVGDVTGSGSITVFAGLARL